MWVEEGSGEEAAGGFVLGSGSQEGGMSSRGQSGGVMEGEVEWRLALELPSSSG